MPEMEILGNGNFGNGNFNPQQIQQESRQRLLDNLREQLDITNDAEWGAVEPLILKVRAGLGCRPQSAAAWVDFGACLELAAAGREGRARGTRCAWPWPARPGRDALQNAIDANAPTEQIQAALANIARGAETQSRSTGKEP